MTTVIEYKSNIMERLGDENTFGFVVLGWVENLQADKKLAKFYSQYDKKSLDMLQRQILNAMLTKHASTDYDEEAFITLRYYRLIDQGFHEGHFDRMVAHLVNSMADSWVDDDVVQEVKRLVGPYRRLFQQAPSTQNKTMSYNETSLLKLIGSTASTTTRSTSPASSSRSQDDMDDLLELYNEVLELTAS